MASLRIDWVHTIKKLRGDLMKNKKLRKILVIIVLVVACVIGYEMLFKKDSNHGANPIPPATQDFDVSSLNSQLVLIKHTSTGYVNYGSGVVVHQDIQKTYILTNAHVLDNLGTIEVINGSLQVAAAVVTNSWDYVNDMVLISVPRSDALTPVTFATSYSVGSLVIAAGYANQVYDITAGLITLITDSKINSNASIQPGQSGSGLFNAEMKLVGLNKQYVVDGNGAWLSTISIKVETIQAYLGAIFV